MSEWIKGEGEGGSPYRGAKTNEEYVTVDTCAVHDGQIVTPSIEYHGCQAIGLNNSELISL